MNLKSNESDQSKVVNEKPVAKNLHSKMKLCKKLFCPPFMQRCDTPAHLSEYKTVWTCTLCERLLLSKAAAIRHAFICKPPITKEEDIPAAELAKMEKSSCYPCEYCNKKFWIKANWIKHVNKHETPDYDISTWGIDLPEDEKK